MNYTPTEIELMNKTARSKGAVGVNAVVPRVVKFKAESWMYILDYGSGPEAIHTKELRKKGFNVVAWDIGKNNIDSIHPSKLSPSVKFDIVFASNVLNIQEGYHVNNVIKEVRALLVYGGKAVFNYPQSPRYSQYNIRHIKGMLIREFTMVEQVLSLHCLPITPVFVCTKER